MAKRKRIRHETRLATRRDHRQLWQTVREIREAVDRLRDDIGKPDPRRGRGWTPADRILRDALANYLRCLYREAEKHGGPEARHRIAEYALAFRERLDRQRRNVRLAIAAQPHRRKRTGGPTDSHTLPDLRRAAPPVDRFGPSI